MAWDEINKVDWVNDWKKLHISSPEDAELKALLTQNSATRQEQLAEFAFLQERIKWRRQRFDEKEISLNLETRIARQIADRVYIESMDNVYETLSENNYNSEAFILKVAEEQDALSKKNLEDAETVLTAEKVKEVEIEIEGGVKVKIAQDKMDNLTTKNEDEDDEDKPDFDIYLRETARIMADWIQFEKRETKKLQMGVL